jgi:hypothetical protein
LPAEGDPGTGQLRASDAERDRVLSRLQDGLVSGMINIDEFNERSEQALRARTRAELASLTADLPTGDLLAGDLLAGGGPAPPDAGARSRCGCPRGRARHSMTSRRSAAACRITAGTHR